MADALRYIESDGHILEPPDLFVNHAPYGIR